MLRAAVAVDRSGQRLDFDADGVVESARVPARWVKAASTDGARLYTLAPPPNAQTPPPSLTSLKADGRQSSTGRRVREERGGGGVNITRLSQRFAEKEK